MLFFLTVSSPGVPRFSQIFHGSVTQIPRELPGSFAIVESAIAALCAVIMVALCNRADHYIFILFLLLLLFPFFSSPNLSSRRLDVYHASAHGVVLV